MKNTKWYIIDHSYPLGHDVISEFSVTEVSACRMNGNPGYRLTLADGNYIYADHESAFLSVDLAKQAYKDKLAKMTEYVKTFKVETQPNNKIVVSEKGAK